MSDCIFCGIIRGEIPSTILYEDEHLLAIPDLHPVAPVHILLIPKKHYRDILELAADAGGQAGLSAALLQAVQQLAAEQGVAERGFRLINNCGAEGGQTIHHLHFHLIGGQDLGARLV